MDTSFLPIILIVCGVYILGRWLKNKRKANEAAAQPSDLQRAVRMADEGRAPGAQPGDSRAVLTKKALDAIHAEQNRTATGATAAAQGPGAAASSAMPPATPPSTPPPTSQSAPQSTPPTAQPAAQAASTGNAGSASAPLREASPSLRSDEAVPVCPVCGQPLIGWGAAGGYCPACAAWQYDRGAYRADRQQYGDPAETLHVLAGYDGVHLTGGGVNRTGRMLVSPGMLLFPADAQGQAIKLFFRDGVGGSVTVGAAQQWIWVVKDGDGRSQCYNIDLLGRSYDHSDGHDLERVKRLADGYREA